MYSVSKSFTATAIGFAVAEKKLTVADKVISFFPDDLPEEVSPYLAELRIRDLLSMSVGHQKEPTGEVVQSENWIGTFLKIPIAYEPGTRFLYNTAATYMLSAIIHKVTGETLLDYLKPRLLDPLGIMNVDWESDPQGINTGGYGLRLKTEDMAKFGQLFLQKGMWKGEQLLPPGWVEEASSVKILQDPEAPQEKMSVNDWLQGYAYQMWRSRHNSYRADGAFGQFILILPDQDAVVVITSESPDLQGELNLVWEHLLPAFQHNEGGEDPELGETMANLSIAPLENEKHPLWEGDINGQIYETADPENGVADSFSIDFKERNCHMLLTTGNQSHRFSFGSGKWVLGKTDRKGPYLVAGAKGSLIGLAPFKVAGSYVWMDDNTLELQLRYIESPHTETIRVTFGEGEAVMEFTNSLNNNSKRVVFDASVSEEV